MKGQQLWCPSAHNQEETKSNLTCKIAKVETAKIKGTEIHR
jgi:hypothetical protein